MTKRTHNYAQELELLSVFCAWEMDVWLFRCVVLKSRSNIPAQILALTNLPGVNCTIDDPDQCWGAKIQFTSFFGMTTMIR